MAEPKTVVPPARKTKSMPNKSTTTSSAKVQTGKVAQNNGHKADVARLSNAIPKK